MQDIKYNGCFKQHASKIYVQGNICVRINMKPQNTIQAVLTKKKLKPSLVFVLRLPAKMEMGKKRMAVLVGCNYPNTQNELHGCINDVLAMKEVLVKRFGFDASHVQLLTDAPGSVVLPTGANIKRALGHMIDQAEAGDVLFFHYSGHGTWIPSNKPGHAFRQDEAIVPCDFNLITGKCS
jgi:hypothetical protein